MRRDTIRSMPNRWEKARERVAATRRIGAPALDLAAMNLHTILAEVAGFRCSGRMTPPSRAGLVKAFLVGCILAGTCLAAGEMSFNVTLPQPANHTFHIIFRCKG